MTAITISKTQKSLPAPADTPVDHLAVLLEQRDRLEVEHQRLGKIDQARADSEARLSALDSEQAEIDQDERAAWSQWAKEPNSPPPAPLNERRSALAQKRVLCAGDLAGALNGAKAVSARLAEIQAELARLNVQILSLRAGAALEEASSKAERVRSLAADMRASWTDLIGLSDYATQARAAAVAGNNLATADVFGTIIAGLNQLEMPDLRWHAPEVAAAAERWRAALQ